MSDEFDAKTWMREWAKAQKPKVGPEGPEGPAGPEGPQGARGDIGARGVDGPEGPKGDKGDRGAKGDRGDQGPPGSVGKESIQWVKALVGQISRGSTVVNPTAVNLIVWRAPFSCIVTNVRGYRIGGSGATINARRNGTSTHLASNLSLTSADTWIDGGHVQNVVYHIGDKLETQIVSVAGSPTQVAVQVDLTRS